MPIIKSAIKALRQDRQRTLTNLPLKTRAKSALAKAKSQPTPESLQAAFSALDKAAKKHVFKKGKVDRLKSRLAKLLKKAQVTAPDSKAKPPAKPKKTAAKKKTKAPTRR